MDVRKDINNDYQKHINSLNPQYSHQNYTDENNNFNNISGEDFQENTEQKTRIRILLGGLMFVLVILGGYFYWISNEVDKIQQPSILMITPQVSSQLPVGYFKKYQVVIFDENFFVDNQIVYKISIFKKKSKILRCKLVSKLGIAI